MLIPMHSYALGHCLLNINRISVWVTARPGIGPTAI